MALGLVCTSIATAALAAAALAPVALGAQPAQAFRAPVLRAHGTRLEWTAAGHHNQYKLLIGVPNDRQMLTVFARSFAPTPIAGAKVLYRVKAASNESPWSNRVEITYPGKPEEGPPHPKEEPPREEEPPSGAPTARYRLDAAKYFDPFAIAPFAPWARRHIALIKGYPPFADIYLSLFGLPVIGYHDPATEGQAPLEASGIQTYVAEVRRDTRLGYAGVYIDDANWSPGFSPSPGPPANLANLIEAIHAAVPRALIEINSHYHDIWPLIQAGDPNVTRALRAVALVCVEFGVGPTSGINSPQEYAEFMRYADTLHARGIHLTLTGDRFNNNVPTMEYNLATYMLLNDGGDYVTGSQLTPLNWWGGFDVSLGSPAGPRERLARGLWTRRYARGVVYTVEPGAAAQKITLARPMHSAEWGTVQSLTLAAGQGAVLVG